MTAPLLRSENTGERSETPRPPLSLLIPILSLLVIALVVACGPESAPELAPPVAPTSPALTPHSSTLTPRLAAPNFSLPSAGGNEVSLSGLLEDHKAVVLVFYRGYF